MGPLDPSRALESLVAASLQDGPSDPHFVVFTLLHSLLPYRTVMNSVTNDTGLMVHDDQTTS